MDFHPRQKIKQNKKTAFCLHCSSKDLFDLFERQNKRDEERQRSSVC